MQLFQLPNIYGMSKNPSIDTYHKLFKDADLITLHGYTEIIPRQICQIYDIYNLHPAPVEIYPQLSGKDPVDRILNNRQKYIKCGSVIHKVTGNADQDHTIISHHRDIQNKSNEQVQILIKNISLSLWMRFLGHVLFYDNDEIYNIKYVKNIW